MSDIEDTIRSSELDCLSRIAGVEQDIFLTVLRHLDCVSLSQLELTCWPVTVKTLALQDRPGHPGDKVKIRSDSRLL